MSSFDDFAAGERDGWASAEIVAAYVDKFGPVTDDAGRQMIAGYDTHGRSVLDLCCGQGNLTAMLVSSGAKVTGVDFSAEMLGRARTSVPEARLIEADAARMPLEDESFDFVFCNFGMMHLPDAPAVLREIMRVLRPGGTFAMATWDAPPRSPAFGTVFGAIRQLADLSKAPAQPDLFAFTEPDFAREVLGAAGLNLTRHDTVQSAWTVAEPGDLFEIFLTATVGARMLLEGQPEERLTAIRNAVTSKVAQSFDTGQGYRIPVTVCVVAATRG